MLNNIEQMLVDSAIISASDWRFEVVDRVAIDPPQPASKDPEKWIRIIRSEREFSQKAVIMYHAVLMGVLLFFTARHCVASAMRARRRKRCLKEQGRYRLNLCRKGNTESVEQCVVDEETPMLRRDGIRARNSLEKVGDTIKAAMMFQPRRIPVLGMRPPSNAESMLILSLLGVNVFCLCFRVVWEVPIVFIFGGRCGLLFVANLPWLYLLAAKNQPLCTWTGLSYERLNIFHRRLGEWTCLLALLHGVGETGAWYYFLLPRGLGLKWYLTLGIVLLGIGALVAYELLYVSSLGSFRQRWYEAFLASHVFLQVVALSFLFFHHHRAKLSVGIALFIFLTDRIMFRALVKSRTMIADLKVMEDGRTVLVSADWLLRTRGKLFGFDLKSGWDPMAHVFLTIPDLGHFHRFQAHPFTIASAAPSYEQQQQHAWLNLIVRARDGFSAALLQFACDHDTALIRLDGPYGSGHALRMLQDNSTRIVIAGGSGIAVAYPLLWALTHSLVNAGDSTAAPARTLLIWVVHETSHISWIGPERLNELGELGVRVIIPPPTSKAGRPDLMALISDQVNSLGACGDDCIGVVVSGPDGMNRRVRNACAKLVLEGRRIDIAVEKFGW